MDRLKIREAGRLVTLLFAAAFVLDGGTANAAVEISTKPTANMTCSGGVCTPTAKKAVLNVNDLATMLASGDVSIRSDASSKDIEIDAALSWTSTNRLTLTSYHSIEFSKPVEIAGMGALTITTNSGGKNGDFVFTGKGHVEFWNRSSSLIINGHSYGLVGSIKALRRALRNTGGTGTFLALQKNTKVRRTFDEPPINKEYSGTFEGLGNKLSNLTIASATTGNVGLFAAIGSSGTVRDLRLEDADVSGVPDFSQWIGVLTGASGGTIIGCFSSGHVSGTGPESFIGGLIGKNFDPIVRSGSAAVVSGNGNGTAVGGLVGANLNAGISGFGFIHQSYATGAVIGSSGAMVGGLTGVNDSAVIEDSYATGSVSGNESALVGGLIGMHGDTDFSPVLRRSYATGAVTGGSGATIGGLIGEDLAQSRTDHSY